MRAKQHYAEADLVGWRCAKRTATRPEENKGP